MKRDNKHRAALKRHMKSLMAKAGMDQSNWTKFRVRNIVSDLAGVKLSNEKAWAWLEDSLGVKPAAQPKVAKKKRAPVVKSEDFYASREWRIVRFEALKKSNGCCVLCGRSNREHGIVLHVDHIKPRSKYPALALRVDNLQILCEDCNLGKGARDETDWRSATSLDQELDRHDWRYH